MRCVSTGWREGDSWAGDQGIWAQVEACSVGGLKLGLDAALK